MKRRIAMLEEFAPPLVFFVLYLYAARWFDRPESDSVLIATAGFMAAFALALISGLLRGSRPGTLTYAAAGFILVFGGATLLLQDEAFIKMKPTFIYFTAAAILAVGLARKRSYLRALMGHTLSLDRQGWHILTRRWTLFFVALGILNELARHTLSTDLWVQLKVFGFVSLTLVFMGLQIPLLRRHQADDTGS